MEEIRSVKSHLNEPIHRFRDGSTARLAMSAWTKDTVADGYWLNQNTIRPLSSRDEYLAECIEDISAKFTYYKEGENIEFVDNGDGTVTINAVPLTAYELSGENGISAEGYTIGLSGGEVDASFKFNYVTANTMEGYNGNFTTLNVNNLNVTALTATTANFIQLNGYNFTANNANITNIVCDTLSVTGGQNAFQVNNDFEIAIEIDGQTTKSSLSAVLNGIAQKQVTEAGGTLIMKMGANEGTVTSLYNNFSGTYLNSVANGNFYEGDVTTTDYSKDICFDISDYLDRGYNKFIYKDYGTWEYANSESPNPNQHGIIVDVSKLKPYMKYTINVINAGYISKLNNNIYAGIQFLFKSNDSPATASFYNVPQVQYKDTDATQDDNLMNSEYSWQENYGNDVTTANTLHKRMVNRAHIIHNIKYFGDSQKKNVAIDIPIMMQNNKFWYDSNWGEGSEGKGFTANYEGAWIWRNGDSTNAENVSTTLFDSSVNQTDAIVSLIVSGYDKASVGDTPSAVVFESSGENISYTNGGFIDFYKGANDEIYFVNMKGGIWW